MPGQIVISNENPNLRITTTLFDGTNYLSWSKSATLFLKNRGKIGYVNGIITPLNVRAPGFDKWDQEILLGYELVASLYDSGDW